MYKEVVDDVRERNLVPPTGKAANSECSVLEHWQGCDKNGGDVDAMLKALASVVVDELMLLKEQGMKPADIRKLYADIKLEAMEGGE